MKRLSYVLILCCVLWGGGEVRAQASVLKFEPETWDFGKIREEDGQVSHTFGFTNEGSAPAVIEKVTVSCGCTTPEYSRAPVRPGEKGSIRITFDPEGRPGAFRKDITVQSGGGKGQNVITISGEVTPRPQELSETYPVKAGDLLLSGEAVNLGYVPRGSVKSSALRCYNPTDRPLTLRVVYDKKRSYCDVGLSAERLAPGQEGVVTITYDLRNIDRWGVLTAGFSLLVDGMPAGGPLSVSGVAVEDFSDLDPTRKERTPKAVFSSQYHNFGVQKPGADLRREFTLSNGGKEPLVIRDMKLGPRMSTTLDPLRTVAPGEEVTFAVILSARDTAPGRLMDHVVLIVNDPDRPMREIRLAATIAE